MYDEEGKKEECCRPFDAFVVVFYGIGNALVGRSKDGCKAIRDGQSEHGNQVVDRVVVRNEVKENGGSEIIVVAFGVPFHIIDRPEPAESARGDE